MAKQTLKEHLRNRLNAGAQIDYEAATDAERAALDAILAETREKAGFSIDTGGLKPPEPVEPILPPEPLPPPPVKE